MRALITGITGFVGSHLAEYLLNNQKQIHIYGLKRWRSPIENVKHIANEIKFENGDLRDFKSIIRVINEVKPDIIFHLAAQSYVVTSYDAPIDTIETNICGTINLLEAVRFVKIDPIIHICSSSEVYGQVSKDDVPITEDTPFRPASPYAVSKVGEDMAAYQYFVAYGLKTIRTRMFTHTGPRRGEVFVLSAFCKQIAEIEKGLKKTVVKVGNLDSIRTFLDVRDAVKAYWLLTQKCPPGEVYNIGGDTTMSIGEMLNMLLTMSVVKEIKVEVDPELLRPADVTLQIPCSDKFKKATGWKPEIPFEKTVEDTLNYWREKINAEI